jgi:hypothetical protein
MVNLEDIKVGDIVRLRKQHPCGSYDWQIVRVGLDIGLVCQVCGRRVLTPRSKLIRQIKTRKQGDGE